ncbi:MAG: DUF502 domain-containing protein [bacterium]
MARNSTASRDTELMHAIGQTGRHLRSSLISGLFVLVPITITVFTLNFVFHATASLAGPLTRLAFGWIWGEGRTPDWVITAVSFTIFVLLVYVTGLITRNILGKRLIAMGEGLILRIPVIKSIYSIAKQVVDAISSSNRNSFKSVVLVEFPHAGVRSLGFVTGSFDDKAGKTYRKVIVPTSPNPTTGFLLFVSADDIHETGLSVEEAFKIIISGGVLSGTKLELESGAEVDQRPKSRR